MLTTPWIHALSSLDTQTFPGKNWPGDQVLGNGIWMESDINHCQAQPKIPLHCLLQLSPTSSRLEWRLPQGDPGAPVFKRLFSLVCYMLLKRGHFLTNTTTRLKLWTRKKLTLGANDYTQRDTHACTQSSICYRRSQMQDTCLSNKLGRHWVKVADEVEETIPSSLSQKDV